MTNKELFEKIKAYESKWGKLGTGCIMHSSDTDDKEVSNTMLKRENEYYAYRKKVLEGKEKNKLAHSATISPDELNEKYWNDQMNSNKLIHAAYAPENPHKQHKYVKIENGRYIYPEDLQKTSTRDTSRLSKKYDIKQSTKGTSGPKEIKKGESTNKNKSDYTKNAQAASVNKYAEIARNGSPAAAAKAIFDNKDFGIDELLYEVEEAFKDGAVKLDPEGSGRLVSGGDKEKFEKARGYIDEISTDLQSWITQVGSSSGKGRAVQDELEKLMNTEIKKMSDASKKEVEHSAIEEEPSATDDYKSFQKLVKKGKEKNTLAHTSVISPEELNARYLKDLEEKSILVHNCNGLWNKKKKKDSLEHEDVAFVKSVKTNNGADVRVTILDSDNVKEYLNKIEDCYKRNQGSKPSAEDLAELKKADDAIEGWIEASLDESKLEALTKDELKKEIMSEIQSKVDDIGKEYKK